MAQVQKVPTNRAFQRLSSFPLDGSCLFENLADAKQYCSSPVAYSGQIIYIQDARTQDELNNGTDSYDKVCFINKDKTLSDFEGAGLGGSLISEIQIDNAFNKVFYS